MELNLAAYLTSGIQAAGWRHLDLWIAALATGADLELRDVDVDAIASGDREPTHTQYDTIAAALNERFGELGADHPIRTWNQLPDR